MQYPGGSIEPQFLAQLSYRQFKLINLLFFISELLLSYLTERTVFSSLLIGAGADKYLQLLHC